MNLQIKDIIHEHRKKSGLTQIELARLAGVGKTVVHAVEKGKLTVRFDILSKILKALNITIALPRPVEELALPLNGKKRQLTRNDILEYYAHERLGLNDRVIAHTVSQFQAAWPRWQDLLARSFLSEAMKSKYRAVLAVPKSNRETADVPVIMISVLEQNNLGYLSGVCDYLTKPVDRERKTLLWAGPLSGRFVHINDRFLHGIPVARSCRRRRLIQSNGVPDSSEAAAQTDQPPGNFVGHPSWVPHPRWTAPKIGALQLVSQLGKPDQFVIILAYKGC